MFLMFVFFYLFENFALDLGDRQGSLAVCSYKALL